MVSVTTDRFFSYHKGDPNLTDWIEFHRNKGNAFDSINRNPLVEELKALIMPYGGWGVLVMDDEDLPDILNGKRWHLPVQIFTNPVSNQCHESSRIYVQHNPQASLATGYCLTDDGLWRSHSWVIEQNTILETTPVLRTVYFGCVLM